MQSSRNNGNGGIQFVNETESIIRESVGPELYDLQNMGKRTGSDAGFEDSDSETEVVRVPTGGHGPKPGKKTKGRVKIRMEFIENKLRRYTTFSKRKTGIMKKAYELSTLTGTQVMLLVASETGHVYTFATRKLQPMITSESGKALIQTCLNSPDNPGPLSSGSGNDQRMNPTGFEETDLNYAITEDESQKSPDSGRMHYGGSSMSRESSATPPESIIPAALNLQTTTSPAHQGMSKSKQPMAMTTYLNPQPAVSSPAQPKQSGAQPGNISMQLPGGIATLLPSGSLHPGTPIAVSAVPGQQAAAGQQQQQQHQPQPQQPTAATPQAIYRLPGTGGQMGQFVTIPGLTGQPTASAASHQQVKPDAGPQSSSAGAATTNPQQPVAMVTAAGTVVYQTPQGLMYASAPSSLGAGIPEGYVLNLPQTPTLVPQNTEQAGGATQQYITIPVPVSLAAGQQMFQPLLTQSAATNDPGSDDKRK